MRGCTSQHVDDGSPIPFHYKALCEANKTCFYNQPVPKPRPRRVLLHGAKATAAATCKVKADRTAQSVPAAPTSLFYQQTTDGHADPVDALQPLPRPELSTCTVCPSCTGLTHMSGLGTSRVGSIDSPAPRRPAAWLSPAIYQPPATYSLKGKLTKRGTISERILFLRLSLLLCRLPFKVAVAAGVLAGEG